MTAQPTILTPGDQAAMIRAAVRSACEAAQPISEAFYPNPGLSDIHDVESALALAALATILRRRVDRVLPAHVTGGAELLARLDAHVHECVTIAEVKRAKEVARG